MDSRMRDRTEKGRPGSLLDGCGIPPQKLILARNGAGAGAGVQSVGFGGVLAFSSGKF